MAPRKNSKAGGSDLPAHAAERGNGGEKTTGDKSRKSGKEEGRLDTPRRSSRIAEKQPDDPIPSGEKHQAENPRSTKRMRDPESPVSELSSAPDLPDLDAPSAPKRPRDGSPSPGLTGGGSQQPEPKKPRQARRGAAETPAKTSKRSKKAQRIKSDSTNLSSVPTEHGEVTDQSPLQAEMRIFNLIVKDGKLQQISTTRQLEPSESLYELQTSQEDIPVGVALAKETTSQLDGTYHRLLKRGGYHLLPSGLSSPNLIRPSTMITPTAPTTKNTSSGERTIADYGDEYFYLPSSKSFSHHEGLWFSPFDLFSNEDLRAYCETYGFGPLITSAQFQRFLRSMQSHHGEFAAEAKRREFERGVLIHSEDDEGLLKHSKGVAWTDPIPTDHFYEYPPRATTSLTNPTPLLSARGTKHDPASIQLDTSSPPRYGRSMRELPPWVTQLAFKFFQPIYLAVQHSLLLAADKLDQTAFSLSVVKRLTFTEGAKIDVKFHLWSDHVLQTSALPIFGAAGVDASGEKLAWSIGQRPATSSQESSASADEDYRASSQAQTHSSRMNWMYQRLGYAVLETEQNRLRVLCKHDVYFENNWKPFMTSWKSEATTYKEMADKAPQLLKDLGRYSSPTVPVPLYVENFVRHFFQKAINLRSMSTSELEKLTPGELTDLMNLEASVAAFMVETEEKATTKKEQMAGEDMKEDNAAGIGADRAARPQGFGLDDSAEIEKEHGGVDSFAKRDEYWLIEYMGLGWYQDQVKWAAGAEVDPATCHEILKDADGNNLLLPDGSVSWRYPEEHALRSEFTFPGFQGFDRTRPLDQAQWDADFAVNPELKASRASHHKISPSWHQLVALAVMLSRGYLKYDKERHQPGHFATMLADETGMGKTWTYFLLCAALKAHSQKLKQDPEFRAPVFEGYKRAFAHGKLDESSFDPESFITAQPEWIGDIRRGTTSASSIHLYVASKLVISEQLDEARRVLDPVKFALVDYSRFRSGNTEKRRMVWSAVDKAVAKGKEVILFVSYGRLISDAGRQTGIDTSSSSSSSLPQPRTLFDSGMSYRTTMLDEIAEARNPSSRLSFCSRRIAEHSEYIVGASATPIYSSPLDAIVIGYVLGLPFVVKRRGPGYLKVPPPANVDGITPKTPFLPENLHADIAGFHPMYKELAKTLSKARTEVARALGNCSTADPRTLLRSAGYKAGVPYHEIISEIPDQAASKENITAFNKAVDAFDAACVKIKTRVIEPLRQRFSPWIIRRHHTSVSYDGLTLTPIIPIIPEVLWVDQPDDQQAAYEAYWRQGPAGSKNFMVEIRRWLREPHGCSHGFWASNSTVPAAIQTLIDYIKPILLANIGLPLSQQSKILVFTLWPSLTPCQLVHLARQGIFASFLHGGLPPIDRAVRIAQFQKDKDHDPFLVAESVADNANNKDRVRTYLPAEGKGARVMFVSGIGNTGVTLHRADHVVFLDPVWNFSEIQQGLGRANRIGQTRKLHAKVIIVRNTVEETIYDICVTKRVFSDGFAGLGQATKEDLTKAVDVGSRDPESLEARPLNPDADQSGEEIAWEIKEKKDHLDKFGAAPKFTQAVPGAFSQGEAGFMDEEKAIEALDRGKEKARRLKALGDDELEYAEEDIDETWNKYSDLDLNILFKNEAGLNTSSLKPDKIYLRQRPEPDFESYDRISAYRKLALAKDLYEVKAGEDDLNFASRLARWIIGRVWTGLPADRYFAINTLLANDGSVDPLRLFHHPNGAIFKSEEFDDNFFHHVVKRLGRGGQTISITTLFSPGRAKAGSYGATRAVGRLLEDLVGSATLSGEEEENMSLQDVKIEGGRKFLRRCLTTSVSMMKGRTKAKDDLESICATVIALSNYLTDEGNPLGLLDFFSPCGHITHELFNWRTFVEGNFYDHHFDGTSDLDKFNPNDWSWDVLATELPDLNDDDLYDIYSNAPIELDMDLQQIFGGSYNQQPPNPALYPKYDSARRKRVKRAIDRRTTREAKAARDLLEGKKVEAKVLGEEGEASQETTSGEEGDDQKRQGEGRGGFISDEAEEDDGMGGDDDDDDRSDDGSGSDNGSGSGGESNILVPSSHPEEE